MSIKTYILMILLLGFSCNLIATQCSGKKVTLCHAQKINNCSNYYQNVSGKNYQCGLTKINGVTSCLADGRGECHLEYF